jgi:hypothetical protein
MHIRRATLYYDLCQELFVASLAEQTDSIELNSLKKKMVVRPKHVAVTE